MIFTQAPANVWASLVVCSTPCVGGDVLHCSYLSRADGASSIFVMERRPPSEVSYFVLCERFPYRSIDAVDAVVLSATGLDLRCGKIRLNFLMSLLAIAQSYAASLNSTLLANFCLED